MSLFGKYRKRVTGFLSSERRYRRLKKRGYFNSEKFQVNISKGRIYGKKF